MVLAIMNFDIHAENHLRSPESRPHVRGILRGRRPVGNFDVHHNVFQIVRPSALRFFTENTMNALLISLFVFLSWGVSFLAGLFRKLKPLGG